MRRIKWQQVFAVLTCLLMMLAVAINRDHKVLGRELAKKAGTTTDSVAVKRVAPDGSVVINTTSLCRVTGYNGTVPLEIYLKDGQISQVVALKNAEAPEFFAKAATLLTRWKGKTPDEAAAMHVDAVSGATFSSKAIIANVQEGMRYASKNVPSSSFWKGLDTSPKFFICLFVVLMAAIVPLFTHNKKYHTVQLILNVVVLGLWSGTFISYSLLTSFLANGVNFWTSLVALVMLTTAAVYPLFGRKQYYCSNVCPFGSLQQLAGRCVPYKLPVGDKTLRVLEAFRQVLWAVLMLCLWSGVLFGWMDYELFTAFIFQSASVVVIVVASLFVLLSMVVKRPYCRFVCPTGTLFKISETNS